MSAEHVPRGTPGEWKFLTLGRNRVIHYFRPVEGTEREISLCGLNEHTDTLNTVARRPRCAKCNRRYKAAGARQSVT